MTSITDNKSGGPVTVNTVVTYTIAFSEDMDSSTLTPASFGNVGTSAATIGSVTETTPTSGVFTLLVTPTNSGSLRLQINAASVVKDAAGNNLDTASAILDDTTLAVDGTPPTLTSITDDKSGGPIPVNTLVTYTVTFNEDMDAGTVTPADFGNSGTATITLGAINEITPGVFTVEATPTTRRHPATPDPCLRRPQGCRGQQPRHRLRHPRRHHSNGRWHATDLDQHHR